MTPHELITDARAHGVELWADGGALKYRGNMEAVWAILPTLKAHKPALIAALTGKAPAPDAAAQTYQASPADLATVADWLDAIGESPEGTAATLDRCRADPEALAYFLALATRPAKPQEDVRNCQAPSPTPVPSRAPRPATESPAVCCGNCGNFIRDRIGDGTGLGSCPTVNPPGLLWPGTVRRCPSFKAVA